MRNELETPPTLTPPRRKPPVVLLVAMLVMIAVIVSVVILLVQQPGVNNTTSAATTDPSNSAYPGASKLTVDAALLGEFKGKFPGSPDTILFYATSDKLQQTQDYYKKILTTAGFEDANSSSITSSRPDLAAVMRMAKANQTVTIYSMAYESLQISSPDIQMFAPLAAQLKAGQTLIIYTSRTDIVNLSANEPTATPVSASSEAYLGPDNKFHTSGLVSVAPSPEVETKTGESTLQVKWVLSVDNDTSLLLTQKGQLADLSLRSNLNLIAKDQNGHSYKFKGGGGSLEDKAWTWTLSYTGLPSEVRQLTLEFDPAFPFQPKTPLSVKIDTLKAAGLPKATAMPGLSIKSAGVQLEVPYAYFGPDFTALVINTYPSEQRLSLPGIAIQSPSVLNKYTLVDDKGRTIKAKSKTLRYELIRVYIQGITPIIFEPVAADAKNLTLKADQLLISFSNSYRNLESLEKSGGTVNVPLGTLLKSGQPQPGPTMTFDGFKVQIESLSAQTDAKTSQVTLNLRYTIQSVNDSDTRLPFVLLFGYATEKDSSISNVRKSSVTKGVPVDTSILLENAANLDEITLYLNQFEYFLPGNWELNLPVRN